MPPEVPKRYPDIGKSKRFGSNRSLSRRAFFQNLAQAPLNQTNYMWAINPRLVIQQLPNPAQFAELPAVSDPRTATFLLLWIDCRSWAAFWAGGSNQWWIRIALVNWQTVAGAPAAQPVPAAKGPLTPEAIFFMEASTPARVMRLSARISTCWFGFTTNELDTGAAPMPQPGCEIITGPERSMTRFCTGWAIWMPEARNCPPFVAWLRRTMFGCNEISTACCRSARGNYGSK